MMRDEILTMQQAADYLKCSYQTVYNHRYKWGFFRMEGSRLWRVEKSTLEKKRKKKNNVIRLVGSADNLGELSCRSTNEKMSIGSILPLRVVRELDKALGQQ